MKMTSFEIQLVLFQVFSHFALISLTFIPWNGEVLVKHFAEELIWVIAACGQPLDGPKAFHFVAVYLRRQI